MTCFNCGDFVGRQAGYWWEMFKAEHDRWVLAGSPPFGRSGKFHLAKRYLNKVQMRGRYLPPTCCLQCQRDLIAKRRKMKAAIGGDHCAVCGVARVPLGNAVCGRLCGIKLAKKAIASGFSFEVRTLRNLEKLRGR